MREGTIDSINFILGLIKGDAYLEFYFHTMLDGMKMKVPLTETLKEWDTYRRYVKDTKNTAIAEKRQIDFVSTNIILEKG